MDRLAVSFGCEILQIIPGRVSTEVDARLSFDSNASIAKARELIRSLRGRGRGPQRVLIKLGSTWEGIKAAEVLEREGIHCNLTLLFSFAQAVACAEAKVTLISPFVGPDLRLVPQGTRRRDSRERRSRRAVGDAHLQLLQEVRLQDRSDGRQLPAHVADHAARRLRSADDQPRAAAGTGQHVWRAHAGADPEAAQASTEARITLDEKSFRWLHNQDPMAVEKLSDGIRQFDADARKLEKWVGELK